MNIVSKLAKSKFRNSFCLKDKEIKIVKEKGFDVIKRHAIEILNERIRKKPQNDGRQTPWKNHPVFVAQHATATCCRKCIEKWHKIPAEKELTDKEIDYFSNLIIEWIKTKSRNLT
ncbi:MAG: DUF4186 domain-containing protein [Candidatus Pacearchaeota archaeon]